MGRPDHDVRRSPPTALVAKEARRFLKDLLKFSNGDTMGSTFVFITIIKQESLDPHLLTSSKKYTVKSKVYGVNTVVV